MGFKVNHYAAKTIQRSYTMQLETVLIELVIGIICSVIAVAGYKAAVWLIFLPSLIISIVCFLLIVTSLYFWLWDKYAK